EYQDRLLNPLGQNNDFFGSSVSIAGDYAIVGAVEDDENGLIDNGSATIFKRIETIWYPHQKFSYPATYYGNNTRFGTSLSINDNQRFVVGAPELFSRKGMVFFGTAK
ncbi:MAG TPA: FG-GAP repeat protein, partial [Chitinophagaceae bacterium]|nr:FG-GAP repeat protein [Chitinophagaceae bacterium]